MTTGKRPPVKMAARKSAAKVEPPKMATRRERPEPTLRSMQAQFPGLYKDAPGSVPELVLLETKCEQHCPACTAPGWCKQQPGQWPTPCRVFVAEFVQCADTAVVRAGDTPHHWDCTYWNHFPKRTPF